MVLRPHKNADNRIFSLYLAGMFALMVGRYLLGLTIPAAVFLLMTMLPIWLGSQDEQLAFYVSCIPLSVAFQYKYAMLVLAVSLLFRHRWKMKLSGVFLTVMIMMVWELAHAFYEPFSFTEFLRDFPELIILGILTSVDFDKPDHKLMIRSLSISVTGVCLIMLVMQLQQFSFDLGAVLGRSARSFRFGQSNMDSVVYALNFNANNLGFICNLATCGSLLLITRKEHRRLDILLAACTMIFAMMTLSRAAIVCLVFLFAVFLVGGSGRLNRKISTALGGAALALAVLVLINLFAPAILENLLERFQRSDIWNGRDRLLLGYWEFLVSSPLYFFFGIGMQSVREKVLPHVFVADVPHMGLQEVWVAWGIVGLFLILFLFWRILQISKRYAGAKRQLYQFMPLLLTLVFTTSGQLLTSSRALMALSFSFICLCMAPIRGIEAS